MPRFRIVVEVEAEDCFDAGRAAMDVLSDGDAEYDVVELTKDGPVFSLETFDSSIVRLANEAAKHGITTVVLVHEADRMEGCPKTRFTFRGDPIAAIGMTQYANRQFLSDDGFEFRSTQIESDEW